MAVMKVKKKLGLAFVVTFTGEKDAINLLMKVMKAIQDADFEIVVPEVGERAIMEMDGIGKVELFMEAKEDCKVSIPLDTEGLKMKKVPVLGATLTFFATSDTEMNLLLAVHGSLQADGNIIRYPTEVDKPTTIGADGVGSVKLHWVAENQYIVSDTIDLRQ